MSFSQANIFIGQSVCMYKFYFRGEIFQQGIFVLYERLLFVGVCKSLQIRLLRTYLAYEESTNIPKPYYLQMCECSFDINSILFRLQTFVVVVVVNCYHILHKNKISSLLHLKNSCNILSLVVLRYSLVESIKIPNYTV